MPTKRIPQLTAIAGASTANDDNLVIFDTDADETKRILRSQLAIALAGDLPYTPSGGISATTIPTAIAELDTEKIAFTRLDDNDGSSLVGFLQAGADAVGRSVQARLRDMVSVKDFGAVGNDSTDDSAALQKAIDSGFPLFFPPGTYRCANLTQNTVSQRFYGVGNVNLRKNANGPILTSSAANVEFAGIGFRGDASSPTFTGHNLVSSGNNLRLLNCGSRWAYDRAVLATGSGVQIIGTCDVYQTADGTSNGFDIEIGVSGTLTTYHQLYGIVSTQSTGGIRLVDTGSHVISGGQFGKLSILSGTSPSGVNGGMTMGSRILGAVTVNLSSAIMVANQIGAVALTLGSATSGCMILGNTFANGATVVNNGNANNYVQREISTGSTIELKLGADASLVTLIFDPVSGEFTLPASAVIKNNVAYKLQNAAASGTASLSMTTGDNLAITNTHGAVQITANNGVVSLVGLPTSASGLPSGALWRDATDSNRIKMVP